MAVESTINPRNSTVLASVNTRFFMLMMCMGTDRYVSLRPNFSSQPPYWIMAPTILIDSILKCWVRINWLNPFRLMTGCREPSNFGMRKNWLKKRLCCLCMGCQTPLPYTRDHQRACLPVGLGVSNTALTATWSMYTVTTLPYKWW